MQVRFIDTENSKDVDKFVDFPFRLYAENHQWVPPLVSSARKILNREKPGGRGTVAWKRENQILPGSILKIAIYFRPLPLSGKAME